MKVKDYIDKLKELDPDKDIWVLYDGVAILSPMPSSEADEELVSEHRNEGLNKGDYIISAM